VKPGDRGDIDVDAAVIGGGHNGLTCAAYLAEAGRSVVVLERRESVGGAARSERIFPEHDAQLSRYAYLVSLMPQQIIDELGLDVTLLQRPSNGIDGLGEMTARLAERVFPTMTTPLLGVDAFRRVVGDDDTWKDLFEHPLGELLERRIADDEVRGAVATDGLIGSFTHTHDLQANRCFLHHVVGRGTGDWLLPLGGMGTVTSELASAATRRGAELCTGASVVGLSTDGRRAVVRLSDGTTVNARQVFANVAPAVLAGLLGSKLDGAPPEGAHVKVNLLLSRLPRLRSGERPEDVFAGTFHINEEYHQLERAYRQALAGRIPDAVPCEVYCHSLLDPSILSPSLQAVGAQTLTMFALDLPARLFRDDRAGRLRAVGDAVLASLDSVLAEPIRECLLSPECIEVMGPLELEERLGLPGGHIYHGELQWPFAENASEEGRWGVETAHPNVFVCGAGARRGGGVSGIPGRNAAMAALER
jgi:phytoene dehydrogenase-like protein